MTKVADATVAELYKALILAREDGDLDAAEVLAEMLTLRLRFEPLPHQKPPSGDEWALWLLLGGRGSGKTAAAAWATNEHAVGPPCDEHVPGGHRMGIIGPTFGDTVDSAYYGPSGLARLNPEIKLTMIRGGITQFLWPNGVSMRLFSAYSLQDTERLRAGGGRCFDWYEEMAAWKELQNGYDQATFGLRLGPNPRAVASTTPKNRPVIHRLNDLGRKYEETGQADFRRDRVVLTRATTHDNPHLSPDVRADLYARYAGTRLGEQELEGHVVRDLGTMFQRSNWNVFDTGPLWPMVIRSWDLGGAEPSLASPDPDWTSGARVRFEKGPMGRIHIDDLVHAQRQPHDVERLVIQTAEMDGYDTTVLIEQEGGQAGKAQVQHYARLLTGKAKVVKAFHPSGSKVLRAELLAAAVAQERVSITRANWNTALLDEAESFPDGLHDDIIDSISQALGWMEGSTAGPARSFSPAAERLGLRLGG